MEQCKVTVKFVHNNTYMQANIFDSVIEQIHYTKSLAAVTDCSVSVETRTKELHKQILLTKLIGVNYDFS